MEPVELAYYQLINGQMYPAKIQNERLVATTTPLITGVTNADVSGMTKAQGVSKIDTVTPEFSIEEDEE